MFKITREKTFGLDRTAPPNNGRYVVLDTELTGLDEKKDSIVSIGAVRVTGGKIELGGSYYRLIHPATELTASSVVIHEITPSEVMAKPDVDAVLREFLEFCGNDILVGHFVSIDLEFINREMKRIHGAPLSNPAVDTFSVYEWLRKRRVEHPGLSPAKPAHKLYDIATCFGIPVIGAHNAMMDAFTTAQLFQRFLPMLSGAGVSDIGDLLKIGSPFKGGDRFRQSGESSNF